MAKVHIDFTQVLEDAGFHRMDGLLWENDNHIWKYKVHFEGYAYVLYQDYNDNEVPIAHFRDAERFKIFFEILIDKLEDGEEEII